MPAHHFCSIIILNLYITLIVHYMREVCERILCDDTVRTVVMIQLTAVYYIVYIIVVIYRTNPNSRALAVISVNYN